MLNTVHVPALCLRRELPLGDSPTVVAGSSVDDVRQTQKRLYRGDCCTQRGPSFWPKSRSTAKGREQRRGDIAINVPSTPRGARAIR